jgi:hypothetical protein
VKKLLPLIAVAAVVAVVVFFPTEQKRIRKVITGAAEAVMREDVDGLMEHISFNYRDAHGGSYLLVGKRAEAAFRRYDSLDVTADIVNMDVEESRAEVYLKVTIIASQGPDRGYILGDAEKARDVKIGLEKSAYEWKIINAEGITSGTLGTLR